MKTTLQEKHGVCVCLCVLFGISSTENGIQDAIYDLRSFVSSTENLCTSNFQYVTIRRGRDSQLPEKHGVNYAV